MDYIVRKPDFAIIIERPNYNASPYSAKTIVRFLSAKSVDPITSSALVSYNFKESLSPNESSFSLSVAPETDSKGKDWYDKIKLKDLVFIYEFGECRFSGSVEDKRYSNRMDDEGKVIKTISISGISLGTLLTSFKLIIDQFLYAGSTLAETANTQLKAALTQKMDKGGKVKAVLKTIYKSFFKLALKMGIVNDQGHGIKAVLDEFISFGSKLSDDVVFRYPMALSIYGVGENNIWSILSSIVVPPVNELFLLWNPKKFKYEVVYRQTPFEPKDWMKLPINHVPALLLTDHNLGETTSEVYTYYLATLAGSGIGDRKAMLLDTEGYGNMVAIDENKWKKYGYIPLFVEFKYFDKDKEKEYKEAAKTMKALSEMLKNWFEHNDEFLSGRIDIQTIDNRVWKDIKNPKIGERIGFLDGEFYLEESEHSWAYEDSMVTSLSVSRGYIYSKPGKQLRKIEDLGQKLKSSSRGFDKLWSGHVRRIS